MSEFIKMPYDWHYKLESDILKKEEITYTESDVSNIVFSEMMLNHKRKITIDRIKKITLMYKPVCNTDKVLMAIDKLAPVGCLIFQHKEKYIQVVEK